MLDAPAERAGAIDPWGPRDAGPSSCARRVKERFDPAGVCAPWGADVSGFDDHPRARSCDLIDDCVHCGFCLPTCPTYVLWGEEMDSPRGRIVLMKQGARGAELSAAMVRALDRCLGCMACVTACPSGVKYDKLIEDTRAQVERNVDRRRCRARAPRGWCSSCSPARAACARWRRGSPLAQRLGLPAPGAARAPAAAAPRLAAMAA